MSTINTNQGKPSDSEVATGANSTAPLASSGDQNTQAKQQDSLKKSDVKQEQRLSPDANSIYLQQPEIQQAIVSLMISILASSMQSNSSIHKSENKTVQSKNTSVGAGVSGGGSGSLSAEDQQNSMTTHEEALKSVASDLVKKMLKQMPEKDVNIQIQMMMAKTQNDIISAMWNTFQRGVKENNERNEAASLQHNIQHDAILKEAIKADAAKHEG